MRESDLRLEERKVALAKWVDRYTARFDRELSAAWADLAERLREAVASLSWAELALGPGKDFQQKRIEPAVRRWVERHVQPTVEEADDELRALLQREAGEIAGDAPQLAAAGGALHPLDVLKLLALPSGVLLGGGAVAAAITTTTSLLVFTVIVVDWPILIAGLVVGVALSWFGVATLAGLRQALEERFQKNLLPRMREALIGKGVEYQGKTVPSLKDQLQQSVRDRAEAARKLLEGKG